MIMMLAIIVVSATVSQRIAAGAKSKADGNTKGCYFFHE
jgi:hypothetical protein